MAHHCRGPIRGAILNRSKLCALRVATEDVTDEEDDAGSFVSAMDDEDCHELLQKGSDKGVIIVIVIVVVFAIFIVTVTVIAIVIVVISIINILIIVITSIIDILLLLIIIIIIIRVTTKMAKALIWV